MSSRKIYIFVVCLLVLNTQINWSDASIFDWIWPNRNDFFGNGVQTNNLPSVPFEIIESNEKFIYDTSAILGTKLSELDFCQQRVILAFKKSCNSLTEEEIGKLAVALLNCQHLAESRETYDCSESLSLKDCTSRMTPQAYNTYNVILGRAKAVCLTVRQDQFRGLAEMTVNKLMNSAHQHLHLMNELKKSQQLLEKATLTSLDEMTENHLKLIDKQQEIMKLADAQRISTEANVREIVRERSLIRNGQNDISALIAGLKEKIGDEFLDLQNQNVQIRDVFKELFHDLSTLNDLSDKISLRLNLINETINANNHETSKKFEHTITRLEDANEIVQNFSKTLIGLKEEFEGRVEWIRKYIGEGDDAIKCLTIIIIHIAILLIGMICLVFIHADFLSRIMLLATVALSLTFVLNELISMNALLLIETILALLAGNLILKLSRDFNFVKYFTVNSWDVVKKINLENNNYNGNDLKTKKDLKLLDKSEIPVSATNYSQSTHSIERNRPVVTATPFYSSSLNSDRTSSERSRSVTPNFQGTLSRCKSLTTRGLQCQLLTTLSSTDYCYIHERASRDR